METSTRTVLILRWIQWFFGTYSFGVLFTYFLTNINWYLWIPTLFRAQLALAGIIHIYLYMSAIWISVKPQGPIVWAVLDIVAIILAAATAGLAQPNISLYCTNPGMILWWSDAAFAYVPFDQRAASDKSNQAEILTSSYTRRACGFDASVVVANGILIVLFTITALLQFRLHREQQRHKQQFVTQEEKLINQPSYGGWRKSLAAPFAGRKMNLDV